MIGNLGLLTRTGMDYFYPIFKDMENWRTPNYKDPFPNLPFPNKPRGEDAGRPYRQMLIEVRHTVTPSAALCGFAKGYVSAGTLGSIRMTTQET